MRNFLVVNIETEINQIKKQYQKMFDANSPNKKNRNARHCQEHKIKFSVYMKCLTECLKQEGIEIESIYTDFLDLYYAQLNEIDDSVIRDNQ